MGLSYHFKIAAPAERTAPELERFLKSVEAEAKKMGFEPTLVLDACFDSKARRDFARRLTNGFFLESEKLKGVVVLAEGQTWGHDPIAGSCRVIPERAVVLVLTDEHKCETVFGFFRYPQVIMDINNREIVKTGASHEWVCRDFVDSPDPRFRRIVKLFADAGFVESERDEFAGFKLPPRH